MNRPARRRLFVFVSLAWTSTLAAAEAPSSAATFVRAHCLDCHTGDEAEGRLDLSTFPWSPDDRENQTRWVAIHDRVRNGEMPPAEAEQPADEERAAMLESLAVSLRTTELARREREGRSELRRLSRVEFANALKDVLDLPDLELAEMLPPDGLAHGYAKSAKALDFSHVTVTKYLEVADYALRQALAKRARGLPRQVVRSELKSVDGVKDTLQTLYVQLKQTSGMPLVGLERDPTLDVYRGNFQKREPGYVKDPEPRFDGVATFMNYRANHNVVVKPFKVKQTGLYKLRVHGWGLRNDHGKLVPSDRTETIAFYTPTGRLLGRCDVPPNEPTTSECTAWLREGEPVEYLAISVPNRWFKLPGRDEPMFERFDAYGVGLRWFEMEGPLDEWPPKSHRILLDDLELEPTGELPNGLAYRVVVESPKQEVARLIRRFARRALRRPVTQADVETPIRLARQRLNRKEPFVEALLAGYRAVLVSPAFLLVDERPGELDAWALATRLSLFLTNSPLDAELRAAAASGEILDDDVLRRQTERLLDDPRSGRFVEHFLDHWLSLADITLTEPDENLYPEYNTLLAESMVEETRAFFAEMLREDLPALHVVDSDFLTINQRMAKLYGIDGVHGSHTRRVPIPADHVRGGLLTQGSLLKITANGTTTSPVVRGTFTLDRLLGDPPPPPPPAVPAIEPDISGATTIREQLAQHRADPACASCHAKIDPPGFALESFDVMGGYRDLYRTTLDGGGGERPETEYNGKRVRYVIGKPVDSAGELSDGTPFENVNGFRDLLRKHEEAIARNLLEQFVVYSTGRPVGFVDRPLVDDTMQRLAESDHGVRSMIHEVVQSDLFRRK